MAVASISTSKKPPPETANGMRNRPEFFALPGSHWTKDLNQRELEELPVKKAILNARKKRRNPAEPEASACSICEVTDHFNETHLCGHVGHAKIWVSKNKVETLTRDGREYDPFPKLMHRGKDVTQTEVIVRVPIVNYEYVGQGKCEWRKWRKWQGENGENFDEGATFRHEQYQEVVDVWNTGNEKWCIVGVDVSSCKYGITANDGMNEFVKCKTIDWVKQRRTKSAIPPTGSEAIFNNRPLHSTIEGDPRFYEQGKVFNPGESAKITLVPVHNNVNTHGVSMHCMRIVIRRLVDDWERPDNNRAYFDFVIPVVTVYFIPCPIYREMAAHFDHGRPRAIVGGVYSAMGFVGGYWAASGRTVKEVRAGAKVSIDLRYNSPKFRLVSMEIIPATMWHWCFEITNRPSSAEEFMYRKHITVKETPFPKEATIIIQATYQNEDADRIDKDSMDRYYIEICFRRKDVIPRDVFDELPESFKLQINAYPRLTRKNIAEYPWPPNPNEGVAEDQADKKEEQRDNLTDRYGAHEMDETTVFLLMCLLASPEERETAVKAFKRTPKLASFDKKLADLEKFMKDGAITTNPEIIKKRLRLTKQIEEVSHRARLSALTREAIFTYVREEPSPTNLDGAIGRLSVDRDAFKDWDEFFSGVRVLLSRPIEKEDELADFHDDLESNLENFVDTKNQQQPRHYFRALVDSMDERKIYLRAGLDNFVVPSKLKGGETFKFIIEVQGIRKLIAHFHRALKVLSLSAIQRYFIPLSEHDMKMADDKVESIAKTEEGPRTKKTFQNWIYEILPSFVQPIPYEDRETTKDEQGRTIIGSQTKTIERMIYALGSALTFLLVGPPGAGKTRTAAWFGRLIASGVINQQMLAFLQSKSIAKGFKMIEEERVVGKKRKRRPVNHDDESTYVFDDDGNGDGNGNDDGNNDDDGNDNDVGYDFDQAYEGGNRRTMPHDPSKVRALAVVESNAALVFLRNAFLEVGVPAEDIYRIYSKSAKAREDLTEEMTKYSNVEIVTDKAGNKRYEIGDVKISRIKKATIVLTTLANVGILFRPNLDIGTFSYLFVDEASQVQETHLVVAVASALQHAHPVLGVTVVLAGDIMQLKPVTKELNDALRKGYKAILAESTEQRFSRDPRYDPIGYSANPHPSVASLLTLIHRSHYSLVMYLIRMRYGGLLKCFVNKTNEEEKVPELYKNVMRRAGSKIFSANPELNGLRFVQVDGTEGLLNCANEFKPYNGPNIDDEETSPSVVNPDEAKAIAVLVRNLLDADIDPEKITVIAPYVEQTKLIKHELAKTLAVAKFIKCSTVEVVQGNENDVIIVSCVRTNPDIKLPFIEDEGRFTTAVSRAKWLMLIVGDFRVIQNCGIWNGFCAHAADERLFQTIDGVSIEKPAAAIGQPKAKRGRGRGAPIRRGYSANQDEPGPSGVGHGRGLVPYSF